MSRRAIACPLFSRLPPGLPPLCLSTPKPCLFSSAHLLLPLHVLLLLLSNSSSCTCPNPFCGSALHGYPVKDEVPNPVHTKQELRVMMPHGRS